MTDLRDLLSRATPGWVGAMVAAVIAHNRGVMTPAAKDQARADIETAKAVADALPQIRSLLSELDGARERIAELEAGLSAAIGNIMNIRIDLETGVTKRRVVSACIDAERRARALGEKKS